MKKKKLLAFGLGLIAAGAISGCSTMHTPAGNMTDIKSTDFSKSMIVYIDVSKVEIAAILTQKRDKKIHIVYLGSFPNNSNYFKTLTFLSYSAFACLDLSRYYSFYLLKCSKSVLAFASLYSI